MATSNELYTDPKTVPKVKNLEELIAELHKVFASDRVNVDYVKALMTGYKSNPKDWKKFAIFDDFRYTRNLVDNGNGKFNLIALCWGEGQGSSIHDHMNSHCFMKILDGELRETQYAWPESFKKGEKMHIQEEEEGLAPMKEIHQEVYKKEMVAYICDSIGLHRVENPSHTDKAVSLHLYSPPFDECHTFDERTGHERTVQITFWSKYGERSPFGQDTNQCAVPVTRKDAVYKNSNSNACCSVARIGSTTSSQVNDN